MMNTKLEKALQSSFSYEEYRELMARHVAKGTSSGKEQSEALHNYTMLNDRRMKRLDKTLKLENELVQRVKLYEKKVIWLVLTESWCGDAAHTMPVMNSMAALNEHINFRVALRDENEGLMNEYLTNGSKSIPKLLVIDDESREVIATWGPRPQIATQMVENFKRLNGKLTPEFKQDLQLWYNKDKGQGTAADLVNLMVLEGVGN